MADSFLKIWNVLGTLDQSVKQIAFCESNLQVRNEKRTALMQVTYDLSAILFHCALKGAWDFWGISFCIYN